MSHYTSQYPYQGYNQNPALSSIQLPVQSYPVVPSQSHHPAHLQVGVVQQPPAGASGYSSPPAPHLLPPGSSSVPVSHGAPYTAPPRHVLAPSRSHQLHADGGGASGHMTGWDKPPPLPSHPPPSTTLPSPEVIRNEGQSEANQSSAIPTNNVSEAPPGVNSQHHTKIKQEGYGVRASFIGIKRKGLAAQLMDSDCLLHHQNWTSLWDTEMPADLMSQCQPLHCALCQVTLSSPAHSKMHYSGKIHDKHVRAFFTKLGVQQHLLPVKMDQSGKFAKIEEYKCTTCDVSFTSQSVINIHFMGKNHKRQLALKTPGLTAVGGQNKMAAKSSVYNKDTNKWEKNDNIVTQQKLPPISPEHLFCQICKVGAPNDVQFSQHINGKNHKKKMARSMTDVSTDDVKTIEKRMQFKETIMKKMSGSEQSKAVNNQFAAFRTPSGGYYCGSCNVSAQSQVHFMQHFNSKSHKNKEMWKRMRK